MNIGKVPIDSEEDRAALYRRSAENLRDLAAQVRFNFGRQQQLLALAEAFDRVAERVEPSPARATEHDNGGN